MRRWGVPIVLGATLGFAGAGRGPTPVVTLVRLPVAAIQPQAVAGSEGTIHVLYFSGEPAHGDLFYTRLEAGGAFVPPRRVNSRPGSAVATGTVRGGHLALGRGGRIHVAWSGSDRAGPRAPGGGTPVLYARLDAGGTRFQPQRNVVQTELDGLDAGAIAADDAGHVYVAWHAFVPGLRGESDRRVWVARSSDDGRTFGRETPASTAVTGACGCCGVGLLADRTRGLFVLYRSAIDAVHRDTYLLWSRDLGATFVSHKLQDWTIGACPMSTYALAESSAGVVAAWETAGQVQWLRVDPATGSRSAIAAAGGPARNRKHPAVAINDRGETLLAWTTDTSWNAGGGLAWEVFDRAGGSIASGTRPSVVPAWGLAAAVARPDGSFVIVY